MDRIVDKLDVAADIFPVYTFLFTIQGIPSIYYGSEFGIHGRKANGSDAPLRPKLKLSDMEQNELTKWIQKLAQIRLSRKELMYGEYVELLLTNRQYIYSRRLQREACVVALNNDDSAAEADVSLPVTGNCLEDLMSGEVIPAENGRVHIFMRGHEGRIYRVK